MTTFRRMIYSSDWYQKKLKLALNSLLRIPTVLWRVVLPAVTFFPSFYSTGTHRQRNLLTGRPASFRKSRQKRRLLGIDFFGGRRQAAAHRESIRNEVIMDPEHEIEVVTPAVAADNEAARLEVMRLLAEMEAMDQQSARLHAVLEMNDVLGLRVGASALHSSRISSATSQSARSLPAFAVTPSPPADVAGLRQPRESSLSAGDKARLAALLEEEDDGERAAQVALRHARTTTLQRLLGTGGRTADASVAALPTLANEMLAKARADFSQEPCDQTALTDSIRRMEEELRMLTLKRDAAAQQIELQRLNRELEALQHAGSGT